VCKRFSDHKESQKSGYSAALWLYLEMLGTGGHESSRSGDISAGAFSMMTLETVNEHNHPVIQGVVSGPIVVLRNEVRSFDTGLSSTVACDGLNQVRGDCATVGGRIWAACQRG